MVDRQHQAYDKQMRNLQRSRRKMIKGMANWVRPKRADYVRHKGYVKEAVRSNPGATSGQVYDIYVPLALAHSDETGPPRTYRRVTQLLAELEREGVVYGLKANRGKRGRTRTWAVSRIAGPPLPKWWP
jgi:Cdc6-like AAA superfamily ATPase